MFLKIPNTQVVPPIKSLSGVGCKDGHFESFQVILTGCYAWEPKGGSSLFTLLMIYSQEAPEFMHS